MLTAAQMREFAEHGFVVVPQAIPASAITAAHAAIDALLIARPPQPGHVGNLAFFERADDQPELMQLIDARRPPALLHRPGVPTGGVSAGRARAPPAPSS